MKDRYSVPDAANWNGRNSTAKLYLHEKVVLHDLSSESTAAEAAKNYGILGYACDEGVKRNQGRPGAFEGPDAIRKSLAKMPNHLPEDCNFFDFGNHLCEDGDMEATQQALAKTISGLLHEDILCAILGGGHDVAYAHYTGLRDFLGPDAKIGIINFDAHFDLRSNESGNNSGTPFYQIALDAKNARHDFAYLCLGIRRDANDKALYDSCSVFGVNFIEMERFRIGEIDQINRELEYFIREQDAIYVTIDLDGFSSAFAPGVSASSPLGFTPDLVLECLKTIIYSKKLRAIDIAEMNPQFDRDQQTAKLAAGLLHFTFHRMSLL